MNRTVSVSADPTIFCWHRLHSLLYIANQLGLPYGLSSGTLFDSFDWRVGTMVENATVTHQSDQTATQQRVREQHGQSSTRQQ